MSEEPEVSVLAVIRQPRDWTRKEWESWAAELITTHSPDQVNDTLADMGEQVWLFYDQMRGAVSDAAEAVRLAELRDDQLMEADHERLRELSARYPASGGQS